MTDIMKKRRDPHRKSVAIRYFILTSQPLNRPGRQMKRSQTMRKPRVLSRLISKKRQPQLPHPPQPLKLPSIDQPPDQLPANPAEINPNYIMNRIAVISFQHSKIIAPWLFSSRTRIKKEAARMAASKCLKSDELKIQV
jgi:hypothetical protein